MIGVTHIPVLCEEAIQNLVSAEYSLFVDATFGGGGHAAAAGADVPGDLATVMEQVLTKSNSYLANRL